MLNIEFRSKLQQEIHHIIEEGMTHLSVSQKSPKKKEPQKKLPEVPDTDAIGSLFLRQKPFPSLLHTVNLFLEQ